MRVPTLARVLLRFRDAVLACARPCLRPESPTRCLPGPPSIAAASLATSSAVANDLEQLPSPVALADLFLEAERAAAASPSGGSRAPI